MKRIFFVSAAVLLCLVILGVAARADESADEAVKRGEAVFNEKCAECHGEKGAGTDKGPPLVHKIYLPNHHADITFHWAVERGVWAHHWRFGNMPKIDGVSKDEVDAVIKYVRKLQGDAGLRY